MFLNIQMYLMYLYLKFVHICIIHILSYLIVKGFEPKCFCFFIYLLVPAFNLLAIVHKCFYTWKFNFDSSLFPPINSCTGFSVSENFLSLCHQYDRYISLYDNHLSIPVGLCILCHFCNFASRLLQFEIQSVCLPGTVINFLVVNEFVIIFM